MVGFCGKKRKKQHRNFHFPSKPHQEKFFLYQSVWGHCDMILVLIWFWNVFCVPLNLKKWCDLGHIYFNIRWVSPIVMLPGSNLEAPLIASDGLVCQTTESKHLHKDATDYIKWVVDHCAQNTFSVHSETSSKFKSRSDFHISQTQLQMNIFLPYMNVPENTNI